MEELFHVSSQCTKCVLFRLNHRVRMDTLAAPLTISHRLFEPLTRHDMCLVAVSGALLPSECSLPAWNTVETGGGSNVLPFLLAYAVAFHLDVHLLTGERHCQGTCYCDP